MPTKKKQLRLKDLKDGAEFRISKRSIVYYALQRLEKGKGIFTSESSGRTFIKPGNTVVYPAEV